MCRKNKIRILALLLCCVFSVQALASGTDEYKSAPQNGEESDAGANSDEWQKTDYFEIGNNQKESDGKHPGDTLIQGDSQTAGDELVCENSMLAMYYNTSTSIVKVVDKRNGHIWSSGQVNEHTETMSKKWNKFFHSLVSADVINTKTMSTASYAPDFDTQTVTYLDNGIRVDLALEGIRVYLTIRITLAEDRLIVEVPDESIRIEDQNLMLAGLYVLPCFGATMYGAGDGYLFIPDGAGALIRFDEQVSGNSNAYHGRIYGTDYGKNDTDVWTYSSKDIAVPDNKIANMPVFGMTHGYKQNAIFYEVTNGKEYCEIVANPAGNYVNWFWNAPYFIYNQIYSQPDNTGTGFRLAQEEPNKVNASFMISFLQGEEADYVGMAKYYRDQLLETGQLAVKEKDGDSIPLLLDCLMGESENNGLYTGGVVVTKLSDLSEWKTILDSEGVVNVLYSLRGAAKGGYSRQDPDDFSLWRKIGTQSELNALREAGMNIVWQSEMNTVFEGQGKRRDLAYRINRLYMEKENYGYLDDIKQFLGLEKVADIVEEIVQNENVTSLAVSSLPNVLYSNYKDRELCDRITARIKVTELLAQLTQRDEYLMFETPNEYAFAYMDAAYDMPISNSGFACENETVPFLQIVLSGSVDMFTEANIVIREEDDKVLQLIDYNVYPQFTALAADSDVLAKTNSNIKVSPSFDDISDDIIHIYKRVDEVLSPVRGAMVETRVVVQDGVVVTTYDNGWSVVVNYSTAGFTQGEITVEAKSAVSVKTEFLQMKGGN